MLSGRKTNNGVAVTYGRVSDVKQVPGGSLDAQPAFARNWAKKHNIEIIGFFQDGGISGGTFNRKEWKEMEAFILANTQVNYLIVKNYDRLIRNLHEALNKLKFYEQKLGITIVAVQEPIHAHPDSAAFFEQRTQLLLNAEAERLKGQQRVLECNRHAWRVEKRAWARGWVWENYTNDQGKRNIRPWPGRDKVVLEMFRMAYARMTFKEIGRYCRSHGWPMKGKSAVRNALTNELFISRKTIPPYLYEDGEVIKLDIPQIVPLWLWNGVQDLLDKGPSKKIYRPDIPLRSFVRCGICHHPMTGGVSKKIYPYLRCDQGCKNSVSGTKADGWLLKALKALSLSPRLAALVEKRAREIASEDLKATKGNKNNVGRELEEARDEYENLQMMRIKGTADEDFYQKWSEKYEAKISELENSLKTTSRPSNQYWSLFNQNLPKLGKLDFLYSDMRVPIKHQFLGLIFPSGLFLTKEGFETPQIIRTFEHNLNRVNRLPNFKIIKEWGESFETPQGAQKEAEIEQKALYFLEFLASVA